MSTAVQPWQDDRRGSSRKGPPSLSSSGYRLNAQILEGHIQNRVLLPIPKIEMPPFVLIDREAFRFHCLAEQVSVPALKRSASGKRGEGSGRHFIVASGHLARHRGRQIVERKINGATAIVLGAFLRIGHKVVILRRGRSPEDLGDIPGSVRVMNQ